MKRAIIVAGLGRCGTSLVMQMLEAGGVPVRGEWPAFECVQTTDRASRDPWFYRNAPGHAVKVIDPHINRLPHDLPALVIWLDRNVEQQAESTLKWGEIMDNLGSPTRPARRGTVAILKRDRHRALCALDAPDRPRLDMTFERLIEDSVRAAIAIANFLAVHEGPGLRVSKAVAAVWPRAATCYPGLLEDELVIGQRVPA